MKLLSGQIRMAGLAGKTSVPGIFPAKGQIFWRSGGGKLFLDRGIIRVSVALENIWCLVSIPAEEEDGFDFKERFTQLKAEYEEQVKKEASLNERIAANLLKVKIDE
jgi:hypothetical protein